jgi:hypothetical protein
MVRGSRLEPSAAWVNWLAMPFNLIVAHQDRRVVQTQRPKPSAYRSSEKLFQADGPIVAYRQRRQELLDESNTKQNGEK